MTMTHDEDHTHATELASALQQLSRVATTTVWNTPIGLADHVATLTTLLATTTDTYPIVRYPDFDPSEVFAAAQHANQLSRRLDEPMRTWIRNQIERTTSLVTVNRHGFDAAVF